mmetsp:Transcript_33012/g.63411  ORF Transcript_33012/g.63411 Transcript_33012/m.63411 type:complete len:86 (-) Transcript_33012:244-501(-)
MPRASHTDTYLTVTWRNSCRKESQLALKAQHQYFDRATGMWMDRENPLSPSVSHALGVLHQQAMVKENERQEADAIAKALRSREA